MYCFCLPKKKIFPFLWEPKRKGEEIFFRLVKKKLTFFFTQKNFFVNKEEKKRKKETLFLKFFFFISSEKKKQMKSTLSTKVFKKGQNFAKALFTRIPKPELSRSETSTYLRRLERLNQSCPFKLEFIIHFPPISEQLPSNVVGNFGFDADAKKFMDVSKNGEVKEITTELSEEKKSLIQQQRCDAIIIVTDKGCRATQNIEENHKELLFILALSSEIAINVVDALFQKEKELSNVSFFAEVPKSWDGFFSSAGFDGSHEPEYYGTTIPAHSFLRTWVIEDITNYKPVQEVFETSAGMDVKYPDDPDIRLPPERDLPTVLIASDTKYSDKKPELEKQFFEDVTRLSDFASGLKGTISIEDAETARKVLVRMFGGAQTLNTSAAWNAMVGVEKMYSEFGIVANPSAQTTFNDIMERKNVSEMYSKLHMLREFVTQFPKFAPQWLEKEVQLQKNVMQRNPKELSKSNEFVIANLTQGSDFAFVKINSQQDLLQVHKRMQTLREWWTKTFTTLTSSAKTLEKEKGTSGVDARTETPIIVFRAKASKIVETAVAMEAQFRVLLNNLAARKDVQPSTRQKIKEWVSESQTSSDNMSAMTISESPDVALPASDVATQFARNLVSFGEQKEPVSKKQEEDEVVFKVAEPLEQNKYDALLKQVQKNLEVLAIAEKKSKQDILTKIEELTKNTAGIMDNIQAQYSNWDLSAVPAKFQTQIKTTLFMCQGAKNILTSVLTDLEQKKMEESKTGNVPEDVFRDIHNILVSQEATLRNYYNSLQLLEANVKADRELNERGHNEKALAQIEVHIEKAKTALREARAKIKEMKQAVYVTNATFGQEAIAKMEQDIATMTKRKDEFMSKARSETTGLNENMRTKMVEESENLLKTVVRDLLGLKQNLLQETDQVNLIVAMHNSAQSLKTTKEKAAHFAKMAEKHRKELEIQQRAQEAIMARALQMQSEKRQVTASYENLDEIEKRRVLQLQIEFRRLILQLEAHLNEPTTLRTTLETDIQALRVFTKANQAGLDSLHNNPDYKTQQTNMQLAIHHAQQRIQNANTENKSRISTRPNNQFLLY